MAGTFNLGALKVEFLGDLTKYNAAASQFAASQKNLENKIKSFGQSSTAFDAHAKAAQAVVAPVNNLSKAVQTSTSHVQAFGSSVSSASPKITQTASALSNLTSKTNAAGSGLKSAASHVTSFAGGILKSIPSTLSFAKNMAEMVVYSKEATLTIAGWVQGIFSQNAAMEQTERAFVGLMGSTSAAQKLLGDLKKFAAATPFEFPELAQDAQLLMGVGVEAKKIIPYMTAIGDATARMGGGADSVNRVTIALVQMKAKGKITGEEMMQLTENRIPAWNILAKTMGMTTAELQEMSQKGQLGAEAIDKLIVGMGKFGGGEMKNQATTFNGLISTIKDNMGQIWVNFMGKSFEKAKTVITWLTTALDPTKLQPFIDAVSVKLGDALGKLIDWITKAAQNIKLFYDEFSKNGGLQIAIGLFDQLKNIFTTVFIDTIFKFGAALLGIDIGGRKAGASAKDIADQTKNLADSISKALGVVQAIASAFADTGIKGQALRAALVAIALAFTAFKIGTFVAAMIPVAISFWGAATAAWAFTAALLANPITWVVIAIVALIAGLILLITNWNTVVKFLTSIWNACVTWLLGTLKTIGDFFTNIFTGIWSFITTIFTNIKNFIVNTFTSVWNFIVSIWKAITGAIMAAVSFIVHWITAPFIQFYENVITPILPLVNFFTQVFTVIYQIIAKLVSMAVDWLMDKFTAAYNFVVSIFNSVYSFIADIWGKIYDWIADKITAIYNFIADTLHRIDQTSSSIWSAISSFISETWDTIYRFVADKITAVQNYITDKWNAVQRFSSDIWASISREISDIWNTIWRTISDFANKIWSTLTDVFNKVKTSVMDTWRSIINGMIDMINGGIRSINGFIKGIADGINKVADALGVDKQYRVGVVVIGQVPHLATGASNFKGGAAIVGERGPELVSLPKGAAVLPAAPTKRLMHDVPMPDIPKFAEGTKGGSPLLDAFNWIIGNIGNFGKGILDQITEKLQLPGILGNFSGAILGKIGGWINDFMGKFLGSMTSIFTGSLPQAMRGQFLLPPGGGYGEQYWYGRHQGMDMQFPQGSPIREIIGGMVLPHTGWYPWGGEVDVMLPNGLWERYEHLSMIAARAGQLVKRGDFLGLSGGGTPQSGLGYWSNGAHLHVQYDRGTYGASIDPLNVWAAFGQFAPFAFAKGGVINEPVFGFGARSGSRYMFGENGPETVTPGASSGRPLIINLVIDGKKLTREVIIPALASEATLQLGGL